jgi:hypothetical protein
MIDDTWKTILWQQFGAAIDMLANAVETCPEQLWRACLWEKQGECREYAQFWYLTFHTLFWLDLYLSGAVKGFAPPAPYTLDELDPAGLLPDRVYTKDELRAYLAYSRENCQAIIAALTDESAFRMCKFGWGEASYAELLLYNMRHIQEHAAQLNLFLGQRAGLGNRWVTKAKK